MSSKKYSVDFSWNFFIFSIMNSYFWCIFKNYDGVFGAFFKAFGADWNCMLKSPTVECSVKTVQSMQIKCKTSGLYSQTQVLKFFHFLKLEKIFQDLKTIERISDCEVLDCCRNECHANGLCTKRYKNISIWNFQFSFSFFFNYI